MKKTLPLLTGLLLPCALQGLAAESPEKIYMVGSFNAWQIPLADPDSEYVLTDPDGDGIYTGSFKIDLSGAFGFKLFTAETDWGTGDNPDVYGVASYAFNSPERIYSNYPYEIQLVSDASIGGTQDVRVSDWNSGILNVEAILNEEGIALTLSSPDQATASFRKGAVLIGDFNDWQLPASADNLNGAIAGVADEANPFVFTFNHDFKPGDVSFVVLTTNTYNSFSYYGAPDGMPAFCLKNLKGETPAEFTVYLRQSPKNRYNNINIKDWTGGDITFKFRTDSYNSSTSSAAAPTLEPTPWYAIVKAEGKEPYIEPLATYQWGNVLYSDLYNIIKEQNAEILFSSENSLTPSKENIYGIAMDTTVVKTDFFSSEFVKGGNPVKVNFKRVGNINISLAENFDLLKIDTYVEKRPEDVEHLWLNGYQTGWIAPNEANVDKLIEFDLIAPGVFAKTVDCEYVEADEYDIRMQFRFFTGLAGWTDEYSLGSNYADFYCEPADMADGKYTSAIVEHGLGNWGLTGWNGGPLYMEVDLNTMTLYLGNTSAVKTLDTEPADNAVRYFNLQGMEVKNPGKGLYIKVTGNKSEKIVF